MKRKYHVAWSTAAAIVNPSKKARTDGRNAPGQGRPQLLDKTERYRIKRLAGSNKSAKQITEAINKARAKKQQTAVSYHTVLRAITGGGPALRHLPVERSRVLSQANKKKRAAFCDSNKNWKSGLILFSDSKLVQLYKDDKGFLVPRQGKAWQDPRQRRVQSSSSNPYKLHMYAAVGKNFKSKLMFTNPTPAKGSKAHSSKEAFAAGDFIKVYKKIEAVASKLPGGASKYRLLLDNATQHTAKDTKAAIASAKLKVVEGYPPQSFDINIIEKMWAQLTNRIQHKRAKSVDRWRRILQLSWDEIPIATINKLVAGVGGRMQKIAVAGGEWIEKPGYKGTN